MKHILKFVLQTIIVSIYFIVVIGRFIWNFKWNDTFELFPRGLSYRYKLCVKELMWKMSGRKWSVY